MATPQFAENQGLVHLQAKIGLKMAAAAGLACLDYEDMFQEASISFVIAAKGFDESAGIKFSAYYTKVCFSQFRRTIGVMTGVKNLNPDQRTEIAERKETNKKRAATGKSLLPDIDYKVTTVSFTPSNDEDADTLQDRLVSECPTPEQILEHKQELAAARAKLSPLAQLVVDWLQDPPPELVAELNKQLAHADICTEQRVRVVGLRHGLTVDNIGKFINMVGQGSVTDDDLVRVKTELRVMAQDLEVA